ncbi:MAG TPA: glycosyltransferase family 39 protein [Pyrinomonadaceae bacterium]|jgi:hypothetical protein|nr:glycosyltransferase family 39 protein [Pyrinomonadaceae bacterium]
MNLFSHPVFHRLRCALRARSVRSALFVFTLTRLIIFVIFVLGSQVHFLKAPLPLGQGQDVYIDLTKMSLARTLRPLAERGDGGWYLGIAKEGYEQIPFSVGYHNWAFFPLYPLIVRAASYLTGGYELTGMMLSSLFFFIALVFLYKLTREFGYDDETAERTIFYLAVFPTSYFFSLPLTESLFLLVTVSSFYAARRERWTWAGIFAGLASATRFIGILMLPTLILLYWQKYRARPRVNALGILLAPTGLLVYMVYLRRLTGNAFAFKDAQVAWGRTSGFFLKPLFNYLINPALVAPPLGGGNFYLLHFAVAVLVLVCVYKLARRREWVLAFYTFCSALVPLTSQNMVSFTRYMMVVFPVFMTLGIAGESPRIDITIRTVFLVLFGVLAALFATHFLIAFT